MTRGATALLTALALLLAASTLLAGLHDVSTAWDVFYYHVPFAARLAGVVGPDAYAFHAANQSRLDGFPLLCELLQGICMRLTGRIEGANLVAMGSLALYAGFLRRELRVPLHLSLLGLMAVPLVQIHATSAYVDLPANACLAALVVSVVRLWTAGEPPAPWRFVRLLALAAVVANMRFQLHPLVLLALAAAAPRVLPPIVRGRDWKKLGVALLFVPLVGATFLKNALVHHNPYYPMRLALGGVVLPGPDSAYSSSPATLEHAPRMLRFACSILEIGLGPLRQGRRWTMDQWAPWDSPALRMGGFFGAYVVFHLGLLALRAARERSREAPVTALAFGAFTAVVANLPQSHELRYYLAWMIVLVSLNLGLACERGAPSWQPPALGTACAGFLAVVLWVTRCGYVYPSGSTFDELVRDKVDARVLDRIGDGDRVCLRKEPWTFLYAAPFHRPRRYTVRETETEAACGEDRWIP